MDLITPQFGLIFWQTATLLVVLFILGKYAWKPILSVIQEREDNIAFALQAAEEAKHYAAQVQLDKEALLKTAQAEREKIITEAMVVRDTIIADAKLEAEKASKKAIEQTSALLTQERETALAVLKHDVANLAIQVAEKLLQQELQQQPTQEKLVQRLLKEVHWN